MRRTKIVATIGPASNAEPAIRDLVAAGVDVFRLNFSHGTHAGHGEAIARIRAAAAEAGRHRRASCRISRARRFEPGS